MKTRCLPLAAALGMAALGQVSPNQSLSGKYYFRQVLLTTGPSGSVTGTMSGAGSLMFNSSSSPGTFTITGQQLVGTNAPAALSCTNPCTYTVKSGGFVTLSNPLRPGTTVNARLGVGALVGSSTETGGGVFDLFIAIPAPAQAVSNSTLNGAYWISSLEFPNGGVTNIRDTNFKLTASGAGSFAGTAVTGQAANLNNKLQTQNTTGSIAYAISMDGTGTLTFPPGDTGQLIAGAKSIYVSGDGSYFIGGSMAAGGHGLVVGVKAFTSGATNASWNGSYFAAGIRYDTQLARLAAVSGSVRANGDGNSVWARRTRQSDGLFDAAPLLTYTLAADGSGVFTSTAGHVNLASTGKTFATSGVDVTSSNSYEIYFGSLMPPQSGAGVFLNPQGVFNVGSYAPAGFPVSPGGFLALFGTGFGTQDFTAPGPPFPILTPTGVQVTVNGTPAPIYFVLPTVLPNAGLITAIVPYGVKGSIATIIVTINGTKSNSVDVPLAATAPGVLSVLANGLGDGATRHLDGSVVSASNPALRGEIVSVYLSGLGAVNPPVMDGFAAPGVEPLARITGDVRVFIGGQPVDTPLYAGLTPTLAGLYQLNIQIPLTVASGMQDLAVQTQDGFTDLVSIAID